MYENIPHGAERLSTEAAIRIVKRASRFAPGKTALAEQFHCPKCDVEMEMPKEGKNVECNCGLRMQVRAFQLYVWPKVEVVA